VDQSAIHSRLGVAAGDLSYRHVAKLTHTHPGTVRRYMRGQPPSVEFVTAFCSALSISADWLLTGNGPMRAGEIKGATLRAAAPADLLGAMAEQLESMRARVERAEVYVQTLETRVRAGLGASMSEIKSWRPGFDGHESTGARADRVADAIAKRSPPPAG